MIAGWWKGLAVQERRILVSGALAAGLLLGWAFIWHPLAQRRDDLVREVANGRATLAYVRAGTVEIERRKGTAKRAGGERAGRSLLALADATARSGGLGDALKRIEPAGPASVKVGFEAVRFDALVAWIEALADDYGIEAVDLSADRAEVTGLVNARVTLQDAP